MSNSIARESPGRLLDKAQVQNLRWAVAYVVGGQPGYGLSPCATSHASYQWLSELGGGRRW